MRPRPIRAMTTRIRRMMRVTERYQTKEQIILRDHLAMERTKLANERTLLSYIRASLYLLLGGIALIGLKDFDDLKVIGYVSLGLSILLLIIGLYRFYQLRKHLRKFYKPINKKLSEK